MSGVPYIFANATTSIPLSELDVNFSTPVTIGNTTVALGNTVTSIGNLTLSAPVISSWTTSGRPGSPSTGEIGYNSTYGGLEVYNGSAWDTITGGPAVSAYQSSSQSISSGTSTFSENQGKRFKYWIHQCLRRRVHTTCIQYEQRRASDNDAKPCQCPWCHRSSHQFD